MQRETTNVCREKQPINVERNNSCMQRETTNKCREKQPINVERNNQYINISAMHLYLREQKFIYDISCR